MHHFSNKISIKSYPIFYYFFSIFFSFRFFWYYFLSGPFMGGSWSVRVYEEGFAHPVGDFAGDFADVLSFPDAKNTTFKIEGVKFALPKSGGENIFQIAFTAQDFSHATYFCVDIFYNLHTGKVVKMMKKEAPTVALMQQEKTAEPLLGSCETDADCPSSCE